jgi:hypothetical protein
VSKRSYHSDLPDDFDLDEHDEPWSRGSRPSRDGRRAPRDFSFDDDRAGRGRRDGSRRDDGRDERRRSTRPWAASDNGGPASGGPNLPGLQREHSRPPAYAPSGDRAAGPPRSYGNRDPRSDARSGARTPGSPAPSARPADNRPSSYGAGRPIVTPGNSRPQGNRIDGMERRYSRPAESGFRGGGPRPFDAPRSGAPRQDQGRVYPARPPFNSPSGSRPAADSTGFRRTYPAARGPMPGRQETQGTPPPRQNVEAGNSE